MKKIIILAIDLLILNFACFTCNAFNLSAGTYIFDNSKQQFNTIKMLVGTDCTTYVLSMSHYQGKDWTSVSLDQDIESVKSYCFVECDNIADGRFNMSLEEFIINKIDSIGARRTELSTSNLYMHPKWVFCPLYSSNYSPGYWRTIDSYNAVPSYTLPIVHINTEGDAPINNKDYYINATLWLDNCGIQEFESLGNEQEPLVIEIKGRGNYTWRVPPKKPYKIKFAKKQSPLGLDNSKHFVLKPDCDDWSGYLRNETGFEISRKMGMPYTTSQKPVEVMLNGEYVGLYFLCEKIRVESGRVEVIEQEDNDSNPENATGGWLLEMRYDGENSVIAQNQNNDPANDFFAFTSEYPKVLSQVQRDYIHDFIYRADSCIYVTNKKDTGWEQYFDINSLARFYVIHEVMENMEAFSGSLFIYKDWGWDEKFMFGPVWDFDNSAMTIYNANSDHFIFEYDSPFQFVWIKELVRFPRFQMKIREIWKEFIANDIMSIVSEHAAQWRAKIVDAEQNDKQRWPVYASWHSETAPAEFLAAISRKVAWLNEQWNVPVGDVNCDGVVTAYDVTCLYDYLLTDDNTCIITCDLDGNGEITAHDLTVLYNILLEE